MKTNYLTTYCSPVFSCLFALLFFIATKANAQTTYTWNSTGTADWTIASNWLPNRISPAADDILAFNNGAISTATNIPAQTVGQLLVSNNTTIKLQAAAAGMVLTIDGLSTGDDLVIDNGAALHVNGANTTSIQLSAAATGSVSGNILFATAAHKLIAATASAINFNSPAVFTQDIGCTGSVFTASGSPNVIVFNAGTTFAQKAGANPFGLTAPNSKVNFKKGSLFKWQHNLAIAINGRTYPNLEVDLAGFNQSPTGTSLLTVDDLTITRGALSLDVTAGLNIKGNITVASGQSLQFNPASVATITLNSSSAQTITNAGVLTFGNNAALTFNNASGITINSNIAVNNTVNFTAGIVSLPNPYVFTFGPAATAAGASNNSFIDGPVKKIGNAGFTFPIGESGVLFTGYVPLKISASADPGDAFTATYIRSDATVLNSNYATGLDHVSRVDYWTLNRNSGSSPIDVTLYWTATSSGNGAASYINNLSKLVVAHYNGSTQWDSYGGSADAGSGFVAGSITWTGVNNFSPFSLGSTDAAFNPLPISLDHIEGIRQGSSNAIRWQVSCGDNAGATMTLQRSADNRNFTALATITADAVRCQQPFTHVDALPVAGINYYRLKIADDRGTISYSNVIAVLNKATGFDIVGLLPNLVKNKAILNVTAAQKTTLQLIITDMAGRQVQAMRYDLVAGSNQFNLQLDKLASGMYQILGHTAEGANKTIRFVKE